MATITKVKKVKVEQPKFVKPTHTLNTVICKDQSLVPITESTYFTTGNVYRCIQIENEYMVYGIVFDTETFNKCFEDHTPTVIERLSKIGMVKDNGKMVSKTAFARDYADVRKYGRGNTHKMLYVGGNGNVFGINAGRGASKKDLIDKAYEIFTTMLEGNLDHIIQGYVKYFTKGIPIGMPYAPYKG